MLLLSWLVRINFYKCLTIYPCRLWNPLDGVLVVFPNALVTPFRVSWFVYIVIGILWCISIIVKIHFFRMEQWIPLMHSICETVARSILISEPGSPVVSRCVKWKTYELERERASERSGWQVKQRGVWWTKVRAGEHNEDSEREQERDRERQRAKGEPVGQMYGRWARKRDRDMG